jgi:hypothetical protein
MKNALKTMLALTIALSVGCGLSEDGESWGLQECPDGCEETREQPQVEATFVSGHLGNYRDCPGDGYSGEAMSQDADAAAGACAPDSECESFMNCEDAQLTVRLTNTGEDAASALQVTSLELFDAEGTSRAVLPLMDTVETTNNKAFDGELDVDEEIRLRVTFLGPEDPYTLLDTSSSEDADRIAGGTHGTIEVTFSAENHDDVKTETTALYPVPSVDT